SQSTSTKLAASDANVRAAVGVHRQPPAFCKISSVSSIHLPATVLPKDISPCKYSKLPHLLWRVAMKLCHQQILKYFKSASGGTKLTRRTISVCCLLTALSYANSVTAAEKITVFRTFPDADFLTDGGQCLGGLPIGPFSHANVRLAPGAYSVVAQV